MATTSRCAPRFGFAEFTLLQGIGGISDIDSPWLQFLERTSASPKNGFVFLVHVPLWPFSGAEAAAALAGDFLQN
jgi:hypothetical protein